MSGNLEADRRDSLLDEMTRWRDRALIAEARLEIRDMAKLYRSCGLHPDDVSEEP